jgi:hypothetical protein
MPANPWQIPYVADGSARIAYARRNARLLRQQARSLREAITAGMASGEAERLAADAEAQAIVLEDRAARIAELDPSTVEDA